MERRDFLKYFGIGATVVPVAGGLLVPDATAKLIEVPKVEIQDTDLSTNPNDLMKIMYCRKAANTTVSIRADDGNGTEWKFTAYVSSMNVQSGFDQYEIDLKLLPIQLPRTKPLR